jgi:DNA-binding NarL/FixJ family response regulator
LRYNCSKKCLAPAALPRIAIRIVIVNDHPIVLLGLSIFIRAQGWEVCVTAADGEEAVAKATGLRLDTVIMD